MNSKRANESAAHIALKTELRTGFATTGGLIALFEQERGDVVVHWRKQTLGIEVECGEGQHVVINVLRDVRNGCELVLVVCKDHQTLGKVARKLRRDLPEEFHSRVGVVDITAWRVLMRKERNI